MDSNETTPARSKLPSWAVPVGIGVAVLLLFVGWFAIKQSMISQGNRHENGMNREYEDGVNYLSDCVVKVKQTAGAAEAQAANIDMILSNAVQGRYVAPAGSTTSAQPGQGAMFSAITEAYPNLDKVSDAFNRVMDVMIGCNTDWRNKQSKMQATVLEYDNWRNGGFWVRTFAGGEFPSNNLRARPAPGETGEARGQAAYDKMSRVVATRDASDAYGSGERKVEDPFTKPTKPAPSTVAPGTTRG